MIIQLLKAKINPSERGELEISDINNIFKRKKLNIEIMSREQRRYR